MRLFIKLSITILAAYTLFFVLVQLPRETVIADKIRAAAGQAGELTAAERTIVLDNASKIGPVNEK